MSLDRRFLDPRRPEEEPSKAEKEEKLIQYQPYLPIVATQVISYYKVRPFFVLGGMIYHNMLVTPRNGNIFPFPFLFFLFSFLFFNLSHFSKGFLTRASNENNPSANLLQSTCTGLPFFSKKIVR